MGNRGRRGEDKGKGKTRERGKRGGKRKGVDGREERKGVWREQEERYERL